MARASFERQAQREKDETLILADHHWRLPGLHPLYTGYGVSAAQLVANGYSISPSFLIERVDEIKGFSPQQRRDYSGSRSILDRPVLYIIAVQKVDAAIPPMLKLVERGPDLRRHGRRYARKDGYPEGERRTVNRANRRRRIRTLSLCTTAMLLTHPPALCSRTQERDAEDERRHGRERGRRQGQKKGREGKHECLRDRRVPHFAADGYCSSAGQLSMGRV